MKMITKKTLSEQTQMQHDTKPVSQLLLDAENPRLASGAGGDTQEDLLKILWTEMAVDEVAFSVAANGFFPEEPLLVIPGDEKTSDQKGKYIVVEGNRRLAAVLLLRNKRLREKLRVTELPEIDAQRYAGLEKLPVSIYPNRESLWTYAGFRHINGAKPWDSFSKAKYVASVHEQYNIPLDDIAKKIGDRHSTVKRLYRGYKILQQAEQKAGFDREDRVRNRFFFSHLYTAADQPEFQEFLGIKPETSLKPNPVPKNKLDELAELMLYLYGQKSAKKEPIVQTQSPDLNILREVISRPASLSALRAGYSLAKAHEISIGDKRRFRNAITSAKEELLQAKGTVTTGYTGDDDLYEMIVEIQMLAGKIKEEMDAKKSAVSGSTKKS